MFFSASTNGPVIERTIGIARTKDLAGPWTIDAQPIVPLTEQIENTSLYFEPTNKTWFLFTNHIARSNYYTESVMVYWSKDLQHWDAHNKAVVVDGRNCTWSHNCIGLPGVMKVGNRLAVLYDAPGGNSTSHMGRDIGLAWLLLPLITPTSKYTSRLLRSGQGPTRRLRKPVVATLGLCTKTNRLMAPTHRRFRFIKLDQLGQSTLSTMDQGEAAGVEPAPLKRDSACCCVTLRESA
jgi:hypothetical protein